MKQTPWEWTMSKAQYEILTALADAGCALEETGWHYRAVRSLVKKGWVLLSHPRSGLPGVIEVTAAGRTALEWADGAASLP